MSTDWQQRFSAGLMMLIPPAIGLICVLILVAPVGGMAIEGTMPSLTLMLVYFWTIFQPRTLPPPAVFIIGLLQDALSGQPLGLGTLILLGAQQLVLRERRVFTARNFIIAWAGFLMVAVIVGFAKWFLSSLYAFQLTAWRPYAMSTMASIALYPLVSAIFGRVMRLMERVWTRP